MTSSPSETTGTSVDLEAFAQEVAASVDGQAEVAFGTAKVRVRPETWKETLTTARDRHGLVFLSWLSATDWANAPALGEDPADTVVERFEVLCAVSNLEDGRLIVFSTDLEKGAASVDTISDVYPGANWHEREAAEMFGIDFVGHPELTKLYLPDGFEGHPLRKDFSLLSREVKPWPGKVDVEDMPETGSGVSTENPEAPPVETSDDGAEV